MMPFDSKPPTLVAPEVPSCSVFSVVAKLDEKLLVI